MRGSERKSHGFRLYWIGALASVQCRDNRDQCNGVPRGGGVARQRGQGLAASGAGRDHRFSHRSREVLGVLADLGASPRAAAAKGPSQRQRAGRGHRDSRRGARRPRALSPPPRRCRLRRIDGATLAFRAGGGAGDPGRGRGARPRSDGAGDRRRGRFHPARQERPRDRSGPVSLGGARQRALRRHLCHAMLLPRVEAQALLPQLERDGVVKLDGASVHRAGNAAVVTQDNPRFLNAEDQTSLDGAEICVDLALLDPAAEVAVMRGAVVEHAKYKGRRVFGAGINLTHLYHGRIPFVWYLQRDLGYINKIYRGLAFADDAPPDEFGGNTIEKPWIAAVEAFAIGGHCQALLVMDYVLAERSAFLTLPARKEGIIPGAANMRLPRFTGDRIARQAILYERRLECDSPEGRLICDEIVETGEMDAAVERVVKGLTGSGVVSAAGNRRALRVAQEPLDMFRAYFAIYAREQAYCHFSPALIANLERYWNAQSRKP